MSNIKLESFEDPVESRSGSTRIRVPVSTESAFSNKNIGQKLLKIKFAKILFFRLTSKWLSKPGLPETIFDI